MDKSLLNKSMIIERLRIIKECIGRMNELSGQNKNDFMSDHRNPASARTYLHHALEAMFDIGRHILAKGATKITHEYKSIVLGLNEASVISNELNQKLIPVAGYRNRLVHFYHEITDKEIYEILKKDLGDLNDFILEINKFLNN